MGAAWSAAAAAARGRQDTAHPAMYGLYMLHRGGTVNHSLSTRENPASSIARQVSLAGSQPASRRRENGPAGFERGLLPRP